MRHYIGHDCSFETSLESSIRFQQTAVKQVVIILQSEQCHDCSINCPEFSKRTERPQNRCLSNAECDLEQRHNESLSVCVSPRQLPMFRMFLRIFPPAIVRHGWQTEHGDSTAKGRCFAEWRTDLRHLARQACQRVQLAVASLQTPGGRKRFVEGAIVAPQRGSNILERRATSREDSALRFSRRH